MPRIILSLALITVVLGALGYGATNAFFSDTETSVANVFTAGAIDLKVDNESYYNGVATSSTSWEATDLTIEKFFNFGDLKPDDYGEDTISLHVETNDAYMCADVTLTSDNDNGLTEPEALVDQTPGPIGQGELADLVNFIWWADDGDNVYEDDEDVISQGPIGGLPLNQAYPITLADSDQNIWTGVGGPVPAEEVHYLGKAWCFGTIGEAPVTQDGGDLGRSPAGDNNNNATAGEPEDGGITCDGTTLGNESQTDSLTADVTFFAVQSRNNEGFQCDEPLPNEATLTLVKVVVNDDLGSAVAGDWDLTADGPTDVTGVANTLSVTSQTVTPGSYNLSETGGPSGYVASDWVCVGADSQTDADTVEIGLGDNVTCTITNDDAEPIACVPEELYADNVVDFNQGLRKNGTSVLPERSIAGLALGAPQSSGAASDVNAGLPPIFGNFFSLGFDEPLEDDGTPAEGGWIIVEFVNNFIVDGIGNDLKVWEVTGGVYPDELIKLEASQDGISWATIASGLTRDAEADLASSGLDWAKFIRLTDVSNPATFPDAEADGYDLDAFSALNCATVPDNN